VEHGAKGRNHKPQNEACWQYLPCAALHPALTKVWGTPRFRYLANPNCSHH